MIQSLRALVERYHDAGRALGRLQTFLTQPALYALSCTAAITGLLCLPAAIWLPGLRERVGLLFDGEISFGSFVVLWILSGACVRFLWQSGLLFRSAIGHDISSLPGSPGAWGLRMALVAASRLRGCAAARGVYRHSALMRRRRMEQP